MRYNLAGILKTIAKVRTQCTLPPLTLTVTKQQTRMTPASDIVGHKRPLFSSFPYTQMLFKVTFSLKFSGFKSELRILTQARRVTLLSFLPVS